mmetsp:Transcript_10245/g.18637  ORF Transcript_10245/g.18637 Transcript_10245/m.18637 type:complete len:201 (-) Transcript_10245:110-712(-)
MSRTFCRPNISTRLGWCHRSRCRHIHSRRSRILRCYYSNVRHWFWNLRPDRSDRCRGRSRKWSRSRLRLRRGRRSSLTPSTLWSWRLDHRRRCIMTIILQFHLGLMFFLWPRLSRSRTTTLVSTTTSFRTAATSTASRSAASTTTAAPSWASSTTSGFPLLLLLFLFTFFIDIFPFWFYNLWFLPPFLNFGHNFSILSFE